MLRLTRRDKLEVLSRNSKFMADLEELSKPFSLNHVFSPQGRARDSVLRSRIIAATENGVPSPEGIKASLERMRRTQQPDEADNMAVRCILLGKSPYKQGEPTTLRYLRDGHFLRLEIDLTAGTKAALLKEIRQTIDAFKPKILKPARKRKQHESTSYIDIWDVYNQKKNGKSEYKIAQELYRKRRDRVTDFSNDAPEIKAVKRAVRAAQQMIASFHYPPR